MSKLKGKVTVITGVASGIGRSTARLFIQSGGMVFGIDRDQKGGEALHQELSSPFFRFYQTDLTQESAPSEVMNACLNAWGRVDVLCNCAGVSVVLPFPNITSTHLETLMSINFFAMFRLCQEAVKVMQKQGGGVIINIASELATVGQPLYTAYCGSKGAVLSFTRALALEYAQDNIQINTVSPGPIETPMLLAEFELDENPQAVKEDAISSIPIGRLGKPEEIAQVMLFLASEAPPLMHGSNLVVDGGRTII